MSLIILSFSLSVPTLSCFLFDWVQQHYNFGSVDSWWQIKKKYDTFVIKRAFRRITNTEQMNTNNIDDCIVRCKRCRPDIRLKNLKWRSLQIPVVNEKRNTYTHSCSAKCTYKTNRIAIVCSLYRVHRTR